MRFFFKFPDPKTFFLIIIRRKANVIYFGKNYWKIKENFMFSNNYCKQRKIRLFLRKIVENLKKYISFLLFLKIIRKLKKIV